MLCSCCNVPKRFHVFDREIREVFAIEGATDLFQSIDELAVRESVHLCSDSNTGNPKASEISFLQLAVLVVKRECAHERIFAEFQVVFSVAVKTFTLLEESFGPLSCGH